MLPILPIFHQYNVYYTYITYVAPMLHIYSYIYLLHIILLNIGVKSESSDDFGDVSGDDSASIVT